MWAKFDDSVADNPKHFHLSSMGQLLYHHCIFWASHKTTNGFIDPVCLPLIAFKAHITDWQPLVEEMMKVPPGYERGVMEQCDGGYMIHDYQDYNPSRTEVEAWKKHKSLERSKAGLASANKRWGYVPKDSDQQTINKITNEYQTGNKAGNKPVTNHITKTPLQNNPVPVPVPQVIDPNIKLVSTKREGAEKSATKKEKQRDQRLDTPQIRIWRHVAGTFPPKPLFDYVIETIGDIPDADRLRAAHVAWISRGFNPRNIEGILGWYKTGVPTHNKNGSGAKPQREAVGLADPTRFRGGNGYVE